MGSDFISVTVSEGINWSHIKPDIYEAITEFYSSNEALLSEGVESQPNSDTVITDEDDDVVALIKELIETRIRPTVQEDGGDVIYRGFTEKGVVLLEMRGSCSGCPSSSVTLKNGIENMLMHYVPEVEGVQEWVDEKLKSVSDEQLDRLEQAIKRSKEQ